MSVQDEIQVAYLKVFADKGRTYNPLRAAKNLGNPELNFPIAVLTGADGEGGTSDFEPLIKASRCFDDGAGSSQMFCIEGTDETLDQNKAEVLNTMIGYFNG